MDSPHNSSLHSLELNRATFEWKLDEGAFSFFGIPSVLFWSNPSMLNMLAPLAQEVGSPLFRLLIAFHSNLGTEEDYHTMVTVLGKDFEEGFLAWGDAVSTAGWGRFELPHYDPSTKRATVIVRHPWELEMQQGQEQNWGCPFLQGKLIGIFSQAFDTGCWADEHVDMDQTIPSVRFEIYPSTLILADELQRLRDERQMIEQRQLASEIAKKSAELQAAQEERVRWQEEALQAQAAIIAELSIPLIPIHDRVVLMPLIGQVDSQRAQRVLETLLQGVADHHADIAILDITGLPVVDTSVANTLIQAARAIRLLGTNIVITGIRPEVAQTLVGLGVELNDMVTRGTLQNGIAYALEQTAKQR